MWEWKAKDCFMHARESRLSTENAPWTAGKDQNFNSKQAKLHKLKKPSKCAAAKQQANSQTNGTQNFINFSSAIHANDDDKFIHSKWIDSLRREDWRERKQDIFQISISESWSRGNDIKHDSHSQEIFHHRPSGGQELLQKSLWRDEFF
jgi:hypothetical protein